MQYIDMHCGTLAEALVRKQKTVRKLKGTMVDVERLQRGEAVAQFFAMFLPQRNEPSWFGCETMPDLSVLMEKMYEVYRNALTECSDILAPAYNSKDLEKNRREGKISAFLTIENGEVAEGKIENLQKFYDMGVRLVTLTWNDENCFGFPHSKNREEMQRGLKGFGKEAVSCMQDLGMIVDVSHLSDGGFYDVADIAKKPFVASHSNCRELAPATRNLTDDMIRILAEHGGVAGINFEPTFLNKNQEDKLSRVERMCDHVEHFIRIGGVECVGIGTDFDGISGQFEIEECTQMEMLFVALHKRGLSEDTLEKIAFHNVERVIREGM